MENKRFIGCYQYSRGTKINMGCFFESGDDIHRYFVYGLIPVAPFSTPPQLEGLSILALDKRSIEMVSKSAEKKDIFVLDTPVTKLSHGATPVTKLSHGSTPVRAMAQHLSLS